MKSKKALTRLLAFSLIVLMLLPISQLIISEHQRNQLISEKKITENMILNNNKVAYSGAKKLDISPQKNRPADFQVSRGNVDRDELALMASIIEAEAANEPYDGKVAVGAVILNRVENSEFPNTLSDVIYQESAFESVANNHYKRPFSDASLEAAQAALAGQDPTKGALYFWNPAVATSGWIWSRPVTGQIGRHVFAK
ncbi:hypothetical protein JCM14036_28880 [Desulfotomaculum defluvii]